MIRLLLDQGLPRSAVRLLGDVGWNVVHAGDIGMARSSDSDILDYARRERRVCVTLDADFHAHLAVSGAARPSTVRARLEAVNGRAKPMLRRWNWSHTRARQPSVPPTTRKKWVRPIDQGRPTRDAALVVDR